MRENLGKVEQNTGGNWAILSIWINSQIKYSKNPNIKEKLKEKKNKKIKDLKVYRDSIYQTIIF